MPDIINLITTTTSLLIDNDKDIVTTIFSKGGGTSVSLDFTNTTGSGIVSILMGNTNIINTAEIQEVTNFTVTNGTTDDNNQVVNINNSACQFTSAYLWITVRGIRGRINVYMGNRGNI